MLDPWIITAFIAAFLASVTWMLAMTRLQISHAYPMTALTFVVVAAILGVVALLAALIPARRAAALDPTRALQA